MTLSQSGVDVKKIDLIHDNKPVSRRVICRALYFLFRLALLRLLGLRNPSTGLCHSWLRLSGLRFSNLHKSVLH